jgi:hypothetical protein
MQEIEVIKFERTTNKPIAKKIMTLDAWNEFKKFTKDYYYKAYQLNFSQFNL